MYFLIYNSSGDTFVRSFTEDEKHKLLSSAEEFTFCDHGMFESDTNYWNWGDSPAIIIKGKVVKPVPKETVVEYEIE